jgi:hypothetical protein
MMTGFVHSLGRVNDDGVTYTCGPSGVAPNGQAGTMPESMPHSAAQRRPKALLRPEAATARPQRAGCAQSKKQKGELAGGEPCRPSSLSAAGLGAVCCDVAMLRC